MNVNTQTTERKLLNTSGPSVLGVCFLQQGGPELILFLGMNEDQAAVNGWQLVINHDVHPLPKSPELNRGKTFCYPREPTAKYTFVFRSLHTPIMVITVRTIGGSNAFCLNPLFPP